MESTLSGSDLSMARVLGALPPAILCIPSGDSGIGTAAKLFRSLFSLSISEYDLQRTTDQGQLTARLTVLLSQAPRWCQDHRGQ